ncbi:hypothetical protein I2I05_05775 [Hymenobacter sp. BT683]|uniref:Uncharacterized protein n=1 Tax=Hymenobacter jeongseonensis TaxID=2791027 RepID=A0ABS0IFT7_9BACT|nr:hypothetical protein [Hymenobacter jeongseonensis]MBF9236899.1 hypothetical protein [Hymenobacter jeongseonensis]
MNYDSLFSNGQPPLQKSSLGGVQNDIFFSVMKIIHRQPQPVRTATSDKVARVSCCCRISELMPLVRQMHDDARARHLAQLGEQSQQAA